MSTLHATAPTATGRHAHRRAAGEVARPLLRQRQDAAGHPRRGRALLDPAARRVARRARSTSSSTPGTCRRSCWSPATCPAQLHVHPQANLRKLVTTVVVPYLVFEILLALFRTTVGQEDFGSMLYIRPALADVVPHGAVPAGGWPPRCSSGCPAAVAALAVAISLVGGLNTVDVARHPARRRACCRSSSPAWSMQPRALRPAWPSRGSASSPPALLIADVRRLDCSSPAASPRSGSTGAPATPTSVCRSGSACSIRAGGAGGGRDAALSALSLIPRSASGGSPPSGRPAWSSTCSTASS